MTGVVRNVTWSQLQMFTVAPANASLAGRAADLGARLEHERRASRPGQVGGARPARCGRRRRRSRRSRSPLTIGLRVAARRPLRARRACVRTPDVWPTCVLPRSPLAHRRQHPRASPSARSSSTDRTCRSTPTWSIAEAVADDRRRARRRRARRLGAAAARLHEVERARLGAGLDLAVGRRRCSPCSTTSAGASRRRRRAGWCSSTVTAATRRCWPSPTASCGSTTA